LMRMTFSKLQPVRHVALDLDGTIYSGAKLFPETIPFLNFLESSGIGFTFLTNNSSKSISDYVSHLGRIGIAAGREQLRTSTQATMEYLREEMPEVQRLFLLGTSSMEGEFIEAGFSSAADSSADEPDAVVVGFDTTLQFSRLCRAAYWIKAGKPFVATHPDRVCPTDQPTLLVDCGSICAALEQATGRSPTVVPGKPDPRMIRGILRRHSLQPHELAMVGDRLYTDMVMARSSGAVGILVLTGETTPADLTSAAARPDFVMGNLAELGTALGKARKFRGAE
jgi:HAD superfamily hydrolase (TIGR01450 family)